MSSYKIVVLDGYTENPGDLSWEALSQLGTLTLYERTAPSEVLERIKAAEIVLTNKVVLDRSIITHSPNLRYIGVLATGYNVVDLEAAKERAIIVTNIPSYSSQAVAQFTFALLLEICHNVGQHSREVFNGRWQTSKDFCFWVAPLIELAGKTMGIIGYGKIGRATAQIAQAMGMRVVVNNPSPVHDNSVESLFIDELLAQSDVISLHCPLTEQTREIIRAETIEKMKDGVILLNTGRGQLINEGDVAEALKRGKIYAAGVDVVSQEPIRHDNSLLGAPNCFITPHIAWATYESRSRLMEIAIANVRGFIEGKIQNQVNL
ncbi:MAG: D-2-hydroxyacid dehydrogenase [Sphaerochaetaceae bacterium]